MRGDVAGNFFSSVFGKKKPDAPDDESEAPTVSGSDALAPARAEADAPASADVTPEPSSEPAPLPEKAEEVGPAPDEPEKKKGWLSRLRDGLSKSSSKLSEGVSAIFTKRKLDDETLEELTDLLISADLGVPAATRITTALAKDKFDKDITGDEVRAALASEVAATLTPLQRPLIITGANKPHIILMAGVNGAGKTTTIGKLAKRFADEGNRPSYARSVPGLDV